jgi:hypothetical protein
MSAPGAIDGGASRCGGKSARMKGNAKTGQIRKGLKIATTNATDRSSAADSEPPFASWRIGHARSSATSAT